MNDFTDSEHYNNLQPEDLSVREKQLLQTHLDREKADHWRKLAGPKPTTFKTFLGLKKWPFWLVAASLLAVVCWRLSSLIPSISPDKPMMASRSDLIDYPFENINVRGTQVAPIIVHTAVAVAAYNKQDYATAFREAAAEDHFFKGVCLLEMNQPEKAIAEFAAFKNITFDEFYYYQGVALQDAGQKQEAKQAFQKVLDSKTVRPNLRGDVLKRMKKDVLNN